MQLILVRHAQPLRVDNAREAADPGLAPLGVEQAERVSAALAHHRIVRVVSSPQRRARDTAAATAAKLGLNVDIADGLAEYDRELPFYLPIEDAKFEAREAYDRIKAGYLPLQIDAEAFRSRVREAFTDIAAGAEATDTVVVFAHGGVINITLQEMLGLDRPMIFPIDYCSITRILLSRTGRRTAATVNENGHVWDLLPRNIADS